MDARSGDISQTVVSVSLMELVSSPVTEKEVRAATRTDAELGVVLNRTLEGWKGPVSQRLKPYSSRADELTTEGGVLLWGSCVIIPKVLQPKVLAELHEVHPGVSRMKALARSYVWWPGIGGEIEELVRRCDTCQKNHCKPASAPVHPWECPSSPWERLHIDHAGPVEGKMFLVVVDSFSKWVDAEVVSSTSSEVTIRVLRSLFATHGLPQTIVSDNAPAFVSDEFRSFLSRNGIRYMNSSPYHPASNGQAEICVRKVKEALRTMGKGSTELQLQRLLFKDHITPSTTTGYSPAELLFKRQLRSALTLLRPESQVMPKSRNVEVYAPSMLEMRFGRGIMEVVRNGLAEKLKLCWEQLTIKC